MRRLIRVRTLIVIGLAVALIPSGAVLVGHVSQVDPATVPTGFLAAHNRNTDIPIDALAKAVKPDGADVFIQHIRLGANEATIWHTHPGPVMVTVVGGELTYEDAPVRECRQQVFQAGTGFTDKGFGYVHRAIAGGGGAEFYAIFILPPGSTHLIPAEPPAACA